MAKQSRLVLVLGKFRVIDLQGRKMKLKLGGSTTMDVNLPPQADVRAGDLLTLYTEVLYAQPSEPPIQ